MNLILFILVSISLTNIIYQEYVFAWFRNFIDKYFKYSLLNKMLRCPTCLGFWCGILTSFAFPEFGISWIVGAFITSITMKTYELLLLKF